MPEATTTPRLAANDADRPNSLQETRRFVRRGSLLVIRRYHSPHDRSETVWVHTGTDDDHFVVGGT